MNALQKHLNAPSKCLASVSVRSSSQSLTCDHARAELARTPICRVTYATQTLELINTPLTHLYTIGPTLRAQTSAGHLNHGLWSWMLKSLNTEISYKLTFGTAIRTPHHDGSRYIQPSRYSPFLAVDSFTQSLLPHCPSRVIGLDGECYGSLRRLSQDGQAVQGWYDVRPVYSSAMTNFAVHGRFARELVSPAGGPMYE